MLSKALVGVALGAAFGFLAALHVFWAFDGTWGAGAAVAVGQLGVGPILRLRSLDSLCSLRHRRLLGPRRWGLLSADAILTPTREPSLLSSQIQQRPGDLRNMARIPLTNMRHRLYFHQQLRAQ